MQMQNIDKKKWKLFTFIVLQCGQNLAQAAELCITLLQLCPRNCPVLCSMFGSGWQIFSLILLWWETQASYTATFDFCLLWEI